MLQTTTNTKTFNSRKIGGGTPGHQQSASHRKSACDLFTAEFEINDIRPAARNILTKGQTQDEISQIAGASISTRGRFISVAEKRSGNPITDRSLYLFVQGNTKDSVDLAVQKIEDIIQMDQCAPLNTFRGGSKYGPQSNAPLIMAPPPTSNGLPQSQMSMPPPVSAPSTSTSTAGPVSASTTCVEKIFIGLDHAPPTFDLRSRLIGSGGANLNYIRTETGAMATLRGRGSLFVDPMMGMESPEPIHLYIEHLRYDGLQAAKQLARNLIETLQQELIQFQQMNPPMSNIHFSAQTTVVQQPHIYTQHTMMTQPPPIMAMPPPQPHAVQAQSLIHTHQVPLQIHPGTQSLVQIQSGQPTISLPPPALPIPMKTIVNAAGAPHLSQPPPSLHLQQHPQPTAQTQIVVNQSLPIPIKTMVPQPNYQYQYIQAATGAADASSAAAQQAAGPSGAVTIQHIYQTAHPSLPTQHVQSIIQPATSFSDVTTTTFAQQLIRSQPPQAQPQQQQQQFITAYMVPPPNLIQAAGQPQHPAPTSHSIIYSSHPPPQLLQQPPYYSMAQPMPPTSHQMITVQQQQQQQQHPPPTIPASAAEVKLEDECGGGKLEEFNEGQQRSMAQAMISTMAAPPPIMTVPPPVQHIIGTSSSSYATNLMQTHQPPPQHHPAQSHMYGHASVSMAQPRSQAQAIHMMPPVSGVPPQQQQQQYVLNPPGWPPSMASVSSQPPPPSHLSQPALHAAPPMEYRPGSGGTTYQQIQHPIMTASAYNNSSIGMPVQYPPPVPFPMQQPPMENSNMIRPGQKRKMMDEGSESANKNGHGDMMIPSNNRQIRMSSGGQFAGQDFVSTSAAGLGRATSLVTAVNSNTNSNDLNQDNYAPAGHRSDERNHNVNPMTMPLSHGKMDQNCGQAIEPPMDEGAYQNSGGPQDHHGGDVSHRGPINAKGPTGHLIRCNIMGKPPPLPHLARVAVDGPPPPILTSSQQPLQRYSNQW